MEAGHSQDQPAVSPEAGEGSRSAQTQTAGVAMARASTGARSLQSPHVINIEDLRRRARRRLPRVVFDYVDGGSDDEMTLRENCRVFQDVTFRPRQAVADGSVDLRTRVLGSDLAFPALLAPIGYLR